MTHDAESGFHTVGSRAQQQQQTTTTTTGPHFGRSLQLAAMEMIFRFSGGGKLVHATGPPQAKIWKIVRAFATNCTWF